MSKPAPSVPASSSSAAAPSARARLLDRLQRSAPAVVVQRFLDVDVLGQAASLAFYALLSLAPLLLVLLWITASLYPPAREALVEQIGSLAGSESGNVAKTIIENASDRPDVGSLAGLWSTLLLFVGATAVFAQLQGALNLIFRTDAQRLDGLKAWLKKRVFSFGVVFGLGFLLLVSMTLATALQVIFARVPSILPVVGTAVSLALYVLAFAFMYHYLPDRRVRWQQALLGGVITAGLFVAGRYAIGLYLATTDPGGAYGSMGALVLMLVWIYYAGVVFFVGALITAVIDERVRARRGEPVVVPEGDAPRATGPTHGS